MDEAIRFQESSQFKNRYDLRCTMYDLVIISTQQKYQRFSMNDVRIDNYINTHLQKRKIKNP